MKEVDQRTARSIPLLAGLSDNRLSELLGRSRVGTYERGRLLFIQGDPAEQFFVVLDGWITIYRDTPDGEQTVLHVARAGESFAEPAALVLGRYPASAQAASDCRVLEVSAQAFSQIIHNEPDTALRTIAQMAFRLQSLVMQVERLQVKTAPQRLASFLLELVPTGSDSAIVTLPYDKALLAARLGMTPESLSRALARLRRENIQSGRGPDIEIRDVARLREFCGGTD